jgi:hypothetical protein
VFVSRRSDEGTKMRNKQSKPKTSAERVVKDIRRKTRRHFSAEDKTLKMRLVAEKANSIVN